MIQILGLEFTNNRTYLQNKTHKLLTHHKMAFAPPADSRSSRAWIDGCFDFAHHGHAGAMLQARQLSKELYVGVHSDEEIAKHKGPTVMNLPERMVAVEACKWCTQPISDAPYVTDPDFMDKYDCKYAVHGDDITTDANGEDCYKVVKDLGRFIVVKRTPSISTTDLVGRMLLFTKNHHILTVTSKSYEHFVSHKETTEEASESTEVSLLKRTTLDRYKQYATDKTGLNPGSAVHIYLPDQQKIQQLVSSSSAVLKKIKDNGIYYINGTFDLFHPGHIQLLKEIRARAEQQNAAVVIGIIDDFTANKYKGLNYPIMSIFERSLCVLQCRYIDGIILQAPYVNSEEYLQSLGSQLGAPGAKVVKVFRGPTEELLEGLDEEGEKTGNGNRKKYEKDIFAIEKKLGILERIDSHLYDNITTEVIVSRVLDNRKSYEERQRKKGWKSENEKKLEAQEKSRPQ